MKPILEQKNSLSNGKNGQILKYKCINHRRKYMSNSSQKDISDLDKQNNKIVVKSWIKRLKRY